MGARILVVDDSPTIRKVVSSILAARGFDSLAAEDGQAALDLLGHEAVDLVLVDFVMPRMNGYQLCRELRLREPLRNLPVVLMSAKGDKIRGQFVQQTGALDAITKPFDAVGLVAVIEGALEKHKAGRGRPVPEGEAMEEEQPADSLRPSGRELSSDPGLRRVQAARELGTAVAKLLEGELTRLPGVGAAGAQSVSDAIERAITPEAMRGIGQLIRTLDFGEHVHEVLAGDIAVISIAEVLQLLELQRQTGALAVSTKTREITLYIVGGRIDFATGQGLRSEFKLGRYLIEDGALAREDLSMVMGNRAGSKRLLGEQLVQLGFVSAEQVRKGLERQTSELVYEVVRWTEGRFSFTANATSPEAKEAALALPCSGLMMEGFRRVDEWRLIEGSFDFDEVLFPDPVMIERMGDDSKLTKQEKAVLASIDGERTIREIVDEVEGSAFELCKILYQFLNSRLVRRRAAA